MISMIEVDSCRTTIKQVASDVLALKGKTSDNPEAIANVMLAYRHLEDASMRLGKVLQALDGGISATTVGA